MSESEAEACAASAFSAALRPEVQALKDHVLGPLLEQWRAVGEGTGTADLVALKPFSEWTKTLLSELPETSLETIVSTCPHPMVRLLGADPLQARNALDWHVLNSLSENKWGRPYKSCKPSTISLEQLFEKL